MAGLSARRREQHLGVDAVNAQSTPAEARADQRFVGGMRWRGSNATRPFAELRVEDEGVCLRLRSRVLRQVVGRWLPTTWILWSEIQEVRRIRGGMPLPGNAGLQFVRAGGDAGRLVFWCTNQTGDRVAELLSGRGVAVVDGGTVW